MPVKSGYEACKEIKQICSENDIESPFICACSAYKSLEDQQKS